MPQFIKKFLLFFITVVLLALPLLLWLKAADRKHDEKPVQVLSEYLKFLYARDFRRAYQFISAEDRRVKTQNDYVRERGPFTGFALEAARKLSGLIEARPVAQQPEGSRSRIRLALKLPDANALAGLLLDWDETRLNSLPAPQQREILSTIDALSRENKLPMVEGEEEFVLLKENSRWKLYLDWAAGVRVNFTTKLPAAGGSRPNRRLRKPWPVPAICSTSDLRLKTAARMRLSRASSIESSPKRWRSIWIWSNAPCCCRCGCAPARSRFLTAPMSCAATCPTTPKP